MIDAAEIALHLRVAADDRIRQRTASRGSWLPSTSTLIGVEAQASTARRIASSVACRMLMRVDLLDAGRADRAAQRLGADLVVEALALRAA